jgi:hypothetical protein
MGTADASGNTLGTNFVAWPGGIGAPTRIPTGGRRTRRGKQTRKNTRHSRLHKRHTRRR